MFDMASLNFWVSMNLIIQLNGELLNQVLQSIDVSMVGKLIFFDLFLDLNLRVSDALSEIFKITVDLSCLFSNCFFHILHKTWPLISSIALFDIGSKEEDIASLLQETETAHDNFVLVVEDTSLAIL